MKHGLNQGSGKHGGKNANTSKHTAGDNANVRLWGGKVSPKGAGGRGGHKTAVSNVEKC